MFKKWSALILFALCTGFLCARADCGEVKLTTYYPAPTGNYKNINTSGNTNLAAAANANVGIGTTAPNAKLDVRGIALVSDKLGIGTTAPNAKLDVRGIALVSGGLGIGTTAPFAPLDVRGQTNTNSIVLTNAAGIPYTYTVSGITYNAGLCMNDVIGWPGKKWLFIGGMPNTDNLTRIMYSADQHYFGGNIGINVFPTQMLDVSGNATIRGRLGIGTTAPPEASLDVTGRIISRGDRTYLLGHDSSGSHWIMAGGVTETTPTVLGENALGFNLNTKTVYVGYGWNLMCIGNFSCTGVKNFSINHPLDPENKYLVHATLEGPENAVFYRGKSQLVNGKAAIALPDYFEALTHKEGRTALLTPLYRADEPVSMLAASEIKDGKFNVRAIDDKNPSQEFYWEVKAARGDVAALKTDLPKNPATKIENQK